METLNERQTKILTYLKETDFITVKELSDYLDVSLVTVRKDLTLLEKNGFLYRTHGGASRKDRFVFEKPILEKESLQVEEKIKIAKRAVKMISRSDFLMLASGTTIYYLAKELVFIDQLTICTPSLGAAMILADNNTINTIQIGGEIRKSSRSATGSIAENHIRQYSSHILFLGVDGIDLNFGLSTSNAAEAQLNRTMMKQADKVVVLADSTKLNRKGFGKIADIQEIDILITNAQVDKKFYDGLKQNGVELIIA